MYIHQTKDWPNFSWDKDAINAKLAKVNKAAGFLAGRLSIIGFDSEELYQICRCALLVC